MDRRPLPPVDARPYSPGDENPNPDYAGEIKRIKESLLARPNHFESFDDEKLVAAYEKLTATVREFNQYHSEMLTSLHNNEFQQETAAHEAAFEQIEQVANSRGITLPDRR